MGRGCGTPWPPTCPVPPHHQSHLHLEDPPSPDLNPPPAPPPRPQGVRACGDRPNPHLYQSLAVLAAESGYLPEARRWFEEATSHPICAKTAAVWHAWAMAESRGGEAGAVRYLFGRGLEANPRSRYIHLSWALWEKEQGQTANARRLLARGHELNRRDPAIMQAWALLEESEGSVEVARDLLQRASVTDPRHVPVWQAWALLEARAGDAERAPARTHSGCRIGQPAALLSRGACWRSVQGRDI